MVYQGGEQRSHRDNASYYAGSIAGSYAQSMSGSTVVGDPDGGWGVDQRPRDDDYMTPEQQSRADDLERRENAQLDLEAERARARRRARRATPSEFSDRNGSVGEPERFLGDDEWGVGVGRSAGQTGSLHNRRTSSRDMVPYEPSRPQSGTNHPRPRRQSPGSDYLEAPRRHLPREIDTRPLYPPTAGRSGFDPRGSAPDSPVIARRSTTETRANGDRKEVFEEFYAESQRPSGRSTHGW